MEEHVYKHSSLHILVVLHFTERPICSSQFHLKSAVNGLISCAASGPASKRWHSCFGWQAQVM